MKQIFPLTLLLTFSFLFAACQAPQEKNLAQPSNDSQLLAGDKNIKNSAGQTSTPIDSPFIPSLEAQLTDVTEGADLYAGVNTAGAGVGVAQAGLLDTGEYLLEAEIVGLPELPEGYFYEGWLVNGNVSPFSVISTGKLENEDGVTYTNVFTSQTDYTDHLEYVVTLEPDDGDPAPAEHVVDGKFQEL